MHETIRFENENGLSATIEIFGDPEKVTVELLRGSHRIRGFVIYLDFDIRNFWDELLLQIMNVGHGNFKNKQEKFETTIKQAVEYLTPFAIWHLDEDARQIKTELNNRRTEIERHEDLVNFIKKNIVEKTK